MSIPFYGATHASACSNTDCSTSATGPGTLDSYVSPIEVSNPTSNIERATTTQVTGTLDLFGNVGFTVTDPRGNDQGFVVSLTTSGYTSSLVTPRVLPSAVTVTGPAAVTTTCFTNAAEGLACADAHGYINTGLPTDVNASERLSDSPVVAVQCPTQSIGFGAYAVAVPIRARLTGMATELFGSLPFSYEATYTATVTEGGLTNAANPFSFVALGCRSEGPTPLP